MGSLRQPALRALRRDGHGAQIVEFAIVVPILLLLVIGIFEFGRAYFSWIVITNGAREGARTAAVGANATAVYDRVISAVGGLPMAGPPVEGSCPPPVGVAQAWCIQAAGLQGNPGTSTSVRVGYNFKPIAPGFAFATGDVIALLAESTMRLE